MHLGGVGQHRVHRGGDGGVQGHGGGQGGAQQFERLLDHQRHLQGPQVRVLAAAEGEDLADQLRGPLAGVGHLLQVLLHHRLILQAQAREVGVAEQGGEDVVEIVGNAAGQGTERFHLLGLAELAFERQPLGDVGGDHHHVFHLAVRVDDRVGGQRHGPAGVVVFGGPSGLAGPEGGDGRAVAAGAGGGAELGDQLVAVERLAVAPFLLACGPVGPDHAQVAVEHDHLAVQAVEDQPLLVFRGAQCLPDLARLGDVHGDGQGTPLAARPGEGRGKAAEPAPVAVFGDKGVDIPVVVRPVSGFRQPLPPVGEVPVGPTHQAVRGCPEQAGGGAIGEHVAAIPVLDEQAVRRGVEDAAHPLQAVLGLLLGGDSPGDVQIGDHPARDLALPVLERRGVIEDVAQGAVRGLHLEEFVAYRHPLAHTADDGPVRRSQRFPVGQAPGPEQPRLIEAHLRIERPDAQGLGVAAQDPPMGVGQPQTERRHGEDLFEQPFAALLGRLGQLAGGDVLVGRDHPPRRRFGKGGDAQVKPALCIRTVAGVVHFEQVALATDDRAQAGLGRGRGGRVLPGRAGAGRKITEAGKDGAGRHAVACGELLPGAVHREDPPLVVEDGDVGREGIHGGAQKLFGACRLRLGAGPFDGVAADAAEHLGVQPVHDQGVLGAGAQRLQGERFVVPGNEGEHRRGRCGR